MSLMAVFWMALSANKILLLRNGNIYTIDQLMGNQACCDTRNRDYQETYPNGEGEQIKPIHEDKKEEETGSKPQGQFIGHQDELNPNVRYRLEHYREQEQQKIGSNPKRTQFGSETYYGPLDEENRPSGHGKIIKHDGSVYLGEWQSGKANGHGVYITKEGPFYEGEFRDNRAEGQGKYFAGSFSYEGYFDNNQFHGKGTENSDQHQFHGDFKEGKKNKGTLTWKDRGDEYVYYGFFNEQGKFQGKGKLTDPKGVYEGDFQEGEKHGDGIFNFQNGLRYEGQYRRDSKQGKGTIFNSNGSIAYEGQFNDDVPDGKGYVYDKSGNKMERLWVKGIDSSALG